METKNLSNKIHIIGSVGSGKTTLAKKLAAKLEVPFYELDNVVWKRHKAGDIIRSEKEREEYLNTLVNSDAWIIEGVHNEEWVSKSFQNADMIIFLDTSYATRSYRIMKRFILQKLGLETSNYTPTLKIFFKMFKWNRRFEENGKPNFFEKYGMYCNKTIVVTNKKQLEDIFL
ncbi:shikimate kinase [Virgibacillus sp. JSM 102003]|uniref:shikimate kinase n=1 Tax=Virgibacillus sp. JSM 102003 TaxID=1562108 RepID=UPI0035BEFA71